MDFQIQYIGDVVIGDWGLQATQSKWSRLQRDRGLKKYVAVGLGQCNDAHGSVVATVVKWLQPNDSIWCLRQYIVSGNDWVPNGHQAIT